jgi:alpha-methylacyl-CoA racemase
MSGPLCDVRVVVLAGMGPVPFLSMLLSDMGAQVVTIIRPSSRQQRALSVTDGLREEHDVVNRGIDRLAVDLKDADAVADLIDFIGEADVFVEGYRPGVVERLGLGPDVLLARNPALVYARLTGWGQTGPLARSAGHDINYVAQSGALHAMARAGEAPRPPINLLGDYAAGGTGAAFGVVSALLAARGSGEGQIIDAAMLDGVALLTARLHGLRAAGLFSDDPGTNYIDSGAPFYEVYRCKDDRFLAVGALEPDFYREFLKGLDADTSDWPEQDDRGRWPELRVLIGDALASRTRDEWAATFEGTDACVTPVLTFDEAARHPHNAERGLYSTNDGVLHPAAAPRLSRTPGRAGGPAGPQHADIDSLRRAWTRGDLP